MVWVDWRFLCFLVRFGVVLLFVGFGFMGFGYCVCVSFGCWMVSCFSGLLLFIWCLFFWVVVQVL